MNETHSAAGVQPRAVFLLANLHASSPHATTLSGTPNFGAAQEVVLKIFNSICIEQPLSIFSHYPLTCTRAIIGCRSIGLGLAVLQDLNRARRIKVAGANV